jgi:hypothetical protein
LKVRNKKDTKRKTLKEKGRAIQARAKLSAKWDATLEGQPPRKGLWLINTQLKRAYGQIVAVRRTGTVVWLSPWGVRVETAANILIDFGDYAYATAVPPGYAINTREGFEVTDA